MTEETIQALHPDPNKTNKRISLEKYTQMKAAMFKVLADKSLTHNELFKALDTELKGKFDGAIGWYGETVKLDLEARKILKRTDDKPQKYLLSSK